MKYISIVVVLFTSSVFAQTFPYNAPDTLRDPNMPNYSMFSRDRYVGPATRPVATQPYIQPVRTNVPVPIFNGTISDKDGYSAVIQNGNDFSAVKIGDTIPWNNAKVIGITADSLALSNNTTIKIGNDLRNQPGPGLPIARVSMATVDVPTIPNNGGGGRGRGRTGNTPNTLNAPNTGQGNFGNRGNFSGGGNTGFGRGRGNNAPTIAPTLPTLPTVDSNADISFDTGF